jgi:hypothetical protein
VAGVENECAAETIQLSGLVMENFDALVDQGVFPILDILAHPMLAKVVLMAVSLVLEHLREEHAWNISPWV